MWAKIVTLPSAITEIPLYVWRRRYITAVVFFINADSYLYLYIYVLIFRYDDNLIFAEIFYSLINYHNICTWCTAEC